MTFSSEIGEMTRFLKFFIKAENLTDIAKEIILGHYGNDSTQITGIFSKWNETIVAVVSSDKSNDVLASLTDGTYAKIENNDELVALSGAHPIALLDHKYHITHFVQSQPFDTISTARFAHLQSNIKAQGQKPYTLINIGLNSPSARDIQNLSEQVDTLKLKNLFELWQTKFPTLQYPQFKSEKEETETKPSIPSSQSSASLHSMVAPVAPSPPTVPTAPAQNLLPPAIPNDQAEFFAALAKSMNQITQRVDQIDLNARNNALLTSNNSNKNYPSRLNFSKYMLNMPKVDLEVEGSLEDSLEGIVNICRVAHANEVPGILVNFLTTNNMTDVMPELSEEELNDAEQFRDALRKIYGTGDPVASFNMIQEKHMEDASLLLRRIKKAWNRVKKVKDNTEISLGEQDIIKDRFIKSIKDPSLRMKLRIWNTPYQDLVKVVRDYKTAEKIENTANEQSSAIAAVAYESCRHCGLAHASETCRSNAKQKTMYNKRLKNNKPVSRAAVKIIPDRYGNDNRYQPVQRERPVMNASYRYSNKKGPGKKVSFQKSPLQTYRNNRGQSKSYPRNPRSHSPKRQFVNKPSMKPKYYNKNFGKVKNSYLTLDEDMGYFEYPFEAVEGVMYDSNQ